MGPRIGPVGEEPQMPDKDTMAMTGTEDTPGGKASPDSQDLKPSVFHSIKRRKKNYSVAVGDQSPYRSFP
ncbi:solute carrier organic anion transporter family member 2B1 [Rhinolophus ferrumequinum]|uniref:Solute carrier organic anion transporter family member 2B1 n=1 Tax=Rhinolophus ferrumequinum TaxID=59479 RepID=A0A7J7WAI0_RHIFE|nr:solute carrier organic anion transporter family member 2B1 [Rhinolophus ferrumequinum]